MKVILVACRTIPRWNGNYLYNKRLQTHRLISKHWQALCAGSLGARQKKSNFPDMSCYHVPWISLCRTICFLMLY